MTGVVLLAAGESKRLGQPKQLVILDGKPLLRRMTETALQARLGGPVVVVLGAVDEPCREVLAGLDVIFVHNPDWHSGMGGSITVGVAAMTGEDLTGVILMLCDQPQVSAELLRSLSTASTDRKIVATRYDGHLGPPAWFSSEMFPKLLQLKGTKEGAKSLIRGESSISWLDGPEAAFDIDSPADLAAALSLFKSNPRTGEVTA